MYKNGKHLSLFCGLFAPPVASGKGRSVSGPRDQTRQPRFSRGVRCLSRHLFPVKTPPPPPPKGVDRPIPLSYPPRYPAPFPAFPLDRTPKPSPPRGARSQTQRHLPTLAFINLSSPGGLLGQGKATRRVASLFGSAGGSFLGSGVRARGWRRDFGRLRGFGFERMRRGWRT